MTVSALIAANASWNTRGLRRMSSRPLDSQRQSVNSVITSGQRRLPAHGLDLVLERTVLLPLRRLDEGAEAAEHPLQPGGAEAVLDRAGTRRRRPSPARSRTTTARRPRRPQPFRIRQTPVAELRAEQRLVSGSHHLRRPVGPGRPSRERLDESVPAAPMVRDRGIEMKVLEIRADGSSARSASCRPRAGRGRRP